LEDCRDQITKSIIRQQRWETSRNAIRQGFYYYRHKKTSVNAPRLLGFDEIAGTVETAGI
jgi:hypothetical protein